jgi:tetratricopeptide (TPR) repeat protein
MQKLVQLIESRKIDEAHAYLKRIKNKLSSRDQQFFSALISQLSGNNKKAIAQYSLLLKTFPKDLGATVNLAAIYNDTGEYAKGLELLLKINSCTTTIEFHTALFDSYFGLGDYTHAEQALSILLQNKGETVDVLERQSVLLLQLGKTEQAVGILQGLADKYGELRPQIYGNLTAAYNRMGEHDMALLCAEKAIIGKPSSWQFHLNKASSLMAMDRNDDAMTILMELLENGHRSPEILGNVARLENLRGNIDISLEYCKEGLSKSPDDVNLLCCYADNLFVLDKKKLAYETYEKSLALKPYEELTNWHYALALLRDERFHDGWEQYKWGFKRKRNGRGLYKFDLNSEWSGENIDGALMVWGEQGIGDELMFSKFLKYIPQSIQHIELRVDPRLVPVLAKRLMTRPGVLVKPYSDEPMAHHIPIGNLPSVLWTNYLADTDRLKSFLSRKESRLNQRLRIGIAWRGGKSERMQSKRSIPLGLFRRLSSLLHSDIQIVMLQYNPLPEEIGFLQTVYRNRVALPSYDALLDIDAWVEHIASCDLLISVDNSTIHFAGAMGIPTIAMIPKYPDFRWGCSGESNSWYESVYLLRNSDAMDLETLAVQVENWLVLKISELRNEL